MVSAIGADVGIGLNVEGGQEAQFLQRLVVVLMSRNMLEFGVNGELAKDLDDRLDDVPIGFEHGIWHGIFESALLSNAGNQPRIICGEDASDREVAISPTINLI